MEWSVHGALGSTDRDLDPVGILEGDGAMGPHFIPINAAGIAKIEAWRLPPPTGGPNGGFIISSETNEDALRVVTREDAIGGRRPTLLIQYASP